MRSILLSLFLLFTTAANAADIYVVKNVAVSVKETDAMKARDQAVTAAGTKGFDELQKKLVAGQYISKQVQATPAQITAAVDSVDVVSEKIGPKEYRATYDVTFNKAEISRIFSITEIQAVEDPEKYLVVPIIVEKETYKIWKNQWLAEWSKEQNQSLTIPLGDLQDVQNLREQDIKNKKYEGIFRIQKRYGATAVALVKAEYLADKQALGVQLVKIKDSQQTTITYEYPGGTGITAQDLFEAAADDIAYRLANNKLTENSEEQQAAPAPKLPEPYSPDAPGTGYLGEKKYADPTPRHEANPLKRPLPTNEPGRSEAVVIAPDLIAWNRIRNKLVNTQGLSDLQIKSFISGQANISFKLDGDIDELTDTLADSDLSLVNKNGKWEIRETE